MLLSGRPSLDNQETQSRCGATSAPSQEPWLTCLQSGESNVHLTAQLWGQNEMRRRSQLTLLCFLACALDLGRNSEYLTDGGRREKR